MHDLVLESTRTVSRAELASFEVLSARTASQDRRGKQACAALALAGLELEVAVLQPD